MKPTRIVNVTPSIPSELSRLPELARNLRWSWNHDQVALFRWLDEELWESTGHNPVRMLNVIAQERLDDAAQDDAFLAHLDRVSRNVDAYMAADVSWFRRTRASEGAPLVAYFSAEFGLTESLTIFAGGLGMLAGDHLKSASDLGNPLIGVGLLYQQGYFRQVLNRAGWQQEYYDNNDFNNLPLTQETGPDGKPLEVGIPFPGRIVKAHIWRAQVGRVPLYLLDTNIAENSEEDQKITDQLYGGDREYRLKQEIVLGIGGCRALDVLGFKPAVCHMNEGHTAFVCLERTRMLMKEYNVSFNEARYASGASLVFTTHTPEAAGHDYFAPDLTWRYFEEYARELGLNRQEFLALGRINPVDDGEQFCMTVLCLRIASKTNAVSRLHGVVSRDMWQGIWPGVPMDEVPIGYITNGVHFRSWISNEMDQLYDRYLGPQWRREPASVELWRRIDSAPAAELWSSHERRRERLVSFARRRLHAQMVGWGMPAQQIAAADEALNPDALTIVFARRFVPYKRINLVLKDPDRLARILNNPDKPVQIIFAGKSHPADPYGHEVIQQIVGLSRQDRFKNRLVFIEGYDMNVARYLTQGADIWLNNPRRLHEACGTSGMKAAANGALNLSTLDGWWDEAWDMTDPEEEPVGWAIGNRDSYNNWEEQDQIEANSIYDLLENEVIPTFYDRGPDRIPRRWIARMKSSIKHLCHEFNTHRMVHEYTDGFYLPCAKQAEVLLSNNLKPSKELAAWVKRIEASWALVKVFDVNSSPSTDFHVGEKISVSAKVFLGDLKADDIRVELYAGKLNLNGDIENPEIIKMKPGKKDSTGITYETTEVICKHSGPYGFIVRALPTHENMIWPLIPGYITWAS